MTMSSLPRPHNPTTFTNSPTGPLTDVCAQREGVDDHVLAARAELHEAAEALEGAVAVGFQVDGNLLGSGQALSCSSWSSSK